MINAKNVDLIEHLAEVAVSINSHSEFLRSREIDLTIYKSNNWDNSIAKTLRNIAVLERLLLILEKKYNRILKQLTDES